MTRYFNFCSAFDDRVRQHPTQLRFRSRYSTATLHKSLCRLQLPGFSEIRIPLQETRQRPLGNAYSTAAPPL
jgi:hypothetical protein